MRTYDIKDDGGRLVAFEVDNVLIGRGGACAIVNGVPNATLVRGPTFPSWFREDCFCEFDVDGQRFCIEEPFGDNSRYLIGPEPPGWSRQIDAVRDAFAEANPWLAWWRGSFGRWKRRRRASG